MAEPDKTAEEKAEAEAADLQCRVEEFNKEMVPLLGKYEVGLGASAFIQPNGTIAARPILFDARKKSENEKSAEPTVAAA